MLLNNVDDNIGLGWRPVTALFSTLEKESYIISLVVNEEKTVKVSVRDCS